MREPTGHNERRTVALGGGGAMVMGVWLSATGQDVVCEAIEGGGALVISHVTVM